jgi:hypothetical protein
VKTILLLLTTGILAFVISSCDDDFCIGDKESPLIYFQNNFSGTMVIEYHNFNGSGDIVNCNSQRSKHVFIDANADSMHFKFSVDTIVTELVLVYDTKVKKCDGDYWITMTNVQATIDSSKGAVKFYPRYYNGQVSSGVNGMNSESDWDELNGNFGGIILQ